MNLGTTEIIMILVIVVLLFGPSKLPGLGKSVGEAIRGFKQSLNAPDEKPASRQLTEETDKTRQS
jgi:sec-independent protein translocase protein TatA